MDSSKWWDSVAKFPPDSRFLKRLAQKLHMRCYRLHLRFVTRHGGSFQNEVLPIIMPSIPIHPLKEEWWRCRDSNPGPRNFSVKLFTFILCPNLLPHQDKAICNLHSIYIVYLLYYALHLSLLANLYLKEAQRYQTIYSHNRMHPTQ